jgi:CRP-like cAMP-binding protein
MKKIFHLFSRLGDSDVDWLAAHGTTQALARGTALIDEGTDPDALFILLEGALEVSTRAAGRVAGADVGEVVGEMSLVDGRTASATVRSAAASKVLRIPRAGLEAQLARDGAFAARFFRGVSITLSERLRAITARQGGVATDDLDELPSGQLGDLHLAGARFDRLLKAALAPGR